MGEVFRRGSVTRGRQITHDMPQSACIPVDDDGGEQVQSGNAVVLALGGPVADFTSSIEADGAFEGVVGFALVQPHLRPPLQVGIHDPSEHEDRALHMPDLSQRERQVILPGIGRELLQDLAWRYSTDSRARREPQDVRPVPLDEVFLDLARDQGPDDRMRGCRVKGVKSLLGGCNNRPGYRRTQS